MPQEAKRKERPIDIRVRTSSFPDDFEIALLSHYHSTNDVVYSDAITLIQKYGHLIEGGSIDSLYKKVQWKLTNSNSVPFPPPKSAQVKFTFIDLFAGIGGFRMALQNLGGKCLFTSEWDKYSKQTYFANYGDFPFGDITDERVKECIPAQFDILCGGFPCQPFSLAGVSKKNSLGRLHGFQDEKQGNLFFHIEEIIQKHRPKAFFLENVKNLVSHDRGNTFRIIKQTLLNLDYSFDQRVIDGAAFVPQHRERTFMIGFDKRIFGNHVKFNFDLIQYPSKKQSLRTILQNEVPPKYTLTDHLWKYLNEYAQKHKEKGNGFGFGLANLDGVTRTISARYHKDGAEILIPQENKNPRRLTPHEAAALQGYPIYPINTKSKTKSLKIPVSDTQAYRQFGNSVVMPLIKAIGEQVVTQLKNS
ncbi:MAG TPA: DNA (cytosine-5-)-methyltransferase [Cytophagales bacterium]|nr:DNA (cytosine-5-)-methyltransferase [Cytophagales bacterium]